MSKHLPPPRTAPRKAARPGRRRAAALSLAATLSVSSAAGADAPLAKGAAPPPPALTSLADLNRITGRFAPADLRADVDKLPESERRALGKLVEAARVMDAIFLRQLWAGNQTMLLDLVAEAGAGAPLGKARLHAFLLNKGPWSELDHDAPFIPGAPPKPASGNVYPGSTTKAELERWMKALPEPLRTQAGGFFTTIRRGPDGGFRVLPYSMEYQGELERAAALLREAAALTQQPTLRSFLDKRAKAFLSNDYYESDVAWMELDSSIEPTIGPYEVYVDGWFNAKASFEAYITIRDDAETARMQKLSAHLQEIENSLPIDPKLRNPKLGALAPIRVVNSIFCAGDGNRGVQTAAYNLPNDERIVKEKGSKRVMLKNVQEAKFRSVLLPIAKVALSAADQKKVGFDAFFTHILMHELMHGLGPHNITAGGKATTVRAQLQDSYSAIEEAKADISGLFAMQHLIDKGVLDKGLAQGMYTTFLASSFRTLGFGLNEAHGRGMALQVNYLLDAGAFRVAKDGSFQVDEAKAREAVKALTGELMTLQAEGDGAKARDLLTRLAVVRPEVQRVLDKLGKIPVDIEPRFPTAERLLKELRGEAAPGKAR